MKKTNLFIGVAVTAALLFGSCGNKCDKTDPTSNCYEQPCDSTDPTSDCYVNPKIEDGTYVGHLSVDQNDGTFFELDSVSVSTKINDDNTMDFTLLKVKFSPMMPVTLDMTVAGVTTAQGENCLILSGDDIVPTAMAGTPFPTYTITNLAGTLYSDKFEVSMKCGNYPLTYSGTK